MKKSSMLIIAIILSNSLAAQNDDVEKRDLPDKYNYDIAAYVWPSYHPDNRAKIFWPDGMGEWQTVLSNKPKYDGHKQPRYPLWGYINEADPYVAEMEIKDRKSTRLNSSH